MGKIKVNITVDEDTHKLAQEKGVNISGVCDKALYDIAHDKTLIELDYKDMKQCHYCQKWVHNQIEKLMWLCPDEQWICEACFREKTREVIQTKSYMF